MVDPAAPHHIKSMIIRGIKPMPAIDRVTALYVLLDDSDLTIKHGAVKTLFSLRDSILKPALCNPFMHPYVLDFLFRRMPPNYSLRLDIIENPSVSDATLIEAASTSIPEHLQVIAEDPSRVMQNTKILEALYKNPDTPKSALDSLIDYAKNCGIVVESIPELGSKAQKTTDIDTILEKIELVLPHCSQDMMQEFSQEELSQIADSQLPAGFEKELMEEREDYTEEEKHALYNAINNLPHAQKIILARRGNREVREILLRDPNTMVLLGLVHNPGLTSREACILVQNKSIDDRIMTILSGNKRLVKDYRMKLALIHNPKFQISEARKLVQELGKYELSTLSKSREVSGAISSFAKRLYETRFGR
ncbi:MAG: hypothetical protein ACMUJM_05755 [bacterium]